jgi:hypothetical protein
MMLIVTEYVPGRRLAWSTVVEGDETGSSAYHGWVHVLTEETQEGPFFLEEIGRKHPGALYRYHQEWVESLARAAREVMDRRCSIPGSPFHANADAEQMRRKLWRFKRKTDWERELLLRIATQWDLLAAIRRAKQGGRKKSQPEARIGLSP